MDLADRIKALRQEHGWSQVQLADRAKVSQQLIAKIEKRRLRETRKLPLIAQAFGLSVDELIYPTKGGSANARAPTPLSSEETALLEAYRAAPKSVKDVIKSALSVRLHLETPARHRVTVDDRATTIHRSRKRRTKG